MHRNDLVRLRHIFDAGREAVAFSSGRSREDLDKDRMLSLSLVRLLDIIGEAARGVSQEFHDAYPDIAWKKMVGMRDRLIHSYFDVDPDMVWETVIEDLPPLITHLERIIDFVENNPLFCCIWTGSVNRGHLILNTRNVSRRAIIDKN